MAEEPSQESVPTRSEVVLVPLVAELVRLAHLLLVIPVEDGTAEVDHHQNSKFLLASFDVQGIQSLLKLGCFLSQKSDNLGELTVVLERVSRCFEELLSLGFIEGAQVLKSGR